MTDYSVEDHGDVGRLRHGSQTFYNLLQEMAETHDKKSHDYAPDSNPSGNYHFAGEMAAMFSHSPQDAGFVGRLAEKLYRIKNLESSGRLGITESIEDTERDIATITALWIADRRDRRRIKMENIKKVQDQMNRGEWSGAMTPTPTPEESQYIKNEKAVIALIPVIDDLNDETLARLEIYVRKLLSDRRHANPSQPKRS